jgi:hypothetical protein
MPFDWRDNLTLAKNLQLLADNGTLGPPEAAYRCIVGRAYYAAFGYAHEYEVAWLNFQGKTRPEDKSQDHGRLRAHFKSKKRWRVADQLSILRDVRNRSDYEADLHEANMSDFSWDAVTLAEAVIAALPPPRGTP